MRIQTTCDDVASTVEQTVGAGGGGGPGHGGQQSGQQPGLGRAVQVDPIKPKLKPPGTKRLKLKYDKPLSKSAFKFNLHHYSLVDVTATNTRQGGHSDEALEPISEHDLYVQGGCSYRRAEQDDAEKQGKEEEEVEGVDSGQSMICVQSDCSYSHADSVRGGRLTLSLVSASVDQFLSRTPVSP